MSEQASRAHQFPKGFVRFLTLEEALKLSQVSKHWRKYVFDNIEDLIPPLKCVEPRYRKVVWLNSLHSDGRPPVFASHDAWERSKLQAQSFVLNCDEIRKDTNRTHFRNLTRSADIESVLLTTLFKAPRPVSYCQGMNYIAALFLVVFKSDAKRASECLYQWLFSEKHKNISRFEHGFYQTTIECQMLNDYCLRYCPRFSSLLKLYSLDLKLFTFTWLLLHFVYELQNHFTILLALWDQLIIRGRKYLSSLSLDNALLESITREKWFDREEEDIIKILKDFPNACLKSYSPSSLLKKINATTNSIDLVENIPISPPIRPNYDWHVIHPKAVQLLNSLKSIVPKKIARPPGYDMLEPITICSLLVYLDPQW